MVALLGKRCNNKNIYQLEYAKELNITKLFFMGNNLNFFDLKFNIFQIKGKILDINKAIKLICFY